MKRKAVTLVLAVSLAAAVVGPAEAKKKAKKRPAPAPVELQYFLRTDEACEAPFLSLKDAEDGDCIFGDGGFSDVFAMFGVDTTAHYAAVDGLPLVLDPSRTVTGTIVHRGWNEAGGVGAAEVDIRLLAMIAGEEEELATYKHSYLAAPAHTETIEFELELEPEVAGLTVDALTLEVYSHGTTGGGRGVEHDEPVSFIKIPAFE